MAKSREFRFERFVALIEALADVGEGKTEYYSLPTTYKDAYDDVLRAQEPSAGQNTWSRQRARLFFEILRSVKKYRDFGYTSMPSFLFHSVWAHFFDREVRGI